jgi:hypothetical protein
MIIKIHTLATAEQYLEHRVDVSLTKVEIPVVPKELYNHRSIDLQCMKLKSKFRQQLDCYKQHKGESLYKSIFRVNKLYLSVLMTYVNFCFSLSLQNAINCAV